MKGTASGPVDYVALGDSTGAGMGANEGGYVARLFRGILEPRPGSKLTNLCLSGATSEDVLRGQLAPAVAVNSTLVTLGIGINDVGLGVSAETFAANFEAIISRLRSETGARIVVTNLPDISTAPRISQMLGPEIRGRTVLFNQRIQEIAAQYGVIVFDIYTTTHELLPSHSEFFSADGFHPSDVGYE